MSTHHIVFTGGGTGGHLFPGLAVAGQLASQLRRVRITFVGSGKDFERRQVQSAGFQYFALPCRPLPRRAREAVPFIVENVAGYLAAGRFLDDRCVDAVVGLGGYASVPMGRAASRRRVPLVLLEQNVTLGRANRWLSRWASLICTSFDQTETQLRAGCPVRTTGTPIRTGPNPVATEPSARRQLLVLGGSGGARSLNENVPRALYKVRESLGGWSIVHQSGEADLEATRQLYRKLALEATVEAFFADLPDRMATAGLAVCRAGGTTLAELSAAGVPALLLPYPHATGDHQRKNAEALLAAGGSLMLDEREISGRLDDPLAEVISGLLADEGRRAAMSRAMREVARPHAAAEVASLIWSLVSSRVPPARLAAA